MNGRRVLVHYHIYKNAGSTIERMLWESFGDRFALFDGTPDIDCIGATTLDDFLRAHPALKAVSSHKARPPLPHRRALPILMLRHPVDRARSAWGFARVNADMPDHEAARNCDFPSYVRWSLATRGHGAVLRDHQLAHLSGVAEPASRDLFRVQSMLTAWPAFGLVRRFGEACRLFNTRYRPFLPAFHLSDTVENATGTPALDDEAALSHIHRELGSDTYQALCDANRMDIALYDFACREFSDKLARLDRPATRIGWRLALQAGRIRQRLSEPSLYRGGPVPGEPPRWTEPSRW